MTLPNNEQLMLPLLEHIRDGNIYKQADLEDMLATHFHLTDEERVVRYDVSKVYKFPNSIRFAKTHLKHAGLIEHPGRGTTRITKRGQKFLAEQPKSVTTRILMRYQEYGEFRKRDKPTVPLNEPQAELEPIRPPEDLLESGYTATRKQLALDLLERIKLCSPRFFERLVLDVLVAMGYGGSLKDAAEAVGQSGDGGIDGIIKEDRLGLDAIYVQAKRWQGNVGSETVQSFVGALHGRQAQKGVFITTSGFTPAARSYVDKIGQKVVLVDGEQLAELMIEYGVGVTPVQTYVVKKMDEDYFEGG